MLDEELATRSGLGGRYILPPRAEPSATGMEQTMARGGTPSTRRSASLLSSSVGVVALITGLLVLPATSSSAAAPLPTISAASVVPKALTPSGGIALFSATVRHASTCKVTISPPVAGLPVSMSCKSSTEFAVSEPINIKSNSSAAHALYKVTLTVTGAGGVVKKTTPLAEAAYKWILTSKPTGSQAQLFSLSCSTLKVCLAVGAGGQAIAFDPSGVHRSTVDGSHSIRSVSCVHGAPLFCVAVDDAGRFLSDTAGVWSPPTSLPTGSDGIAHSVSSVSCAARRNPANQVIGQRCVAADVGGNAFVLDFTTGVLAVSMSVVASGLSGQAFAGCASDTACVVVDAAGGGVRYDGKQWSSPLQLTTKGEFTAASCSSDALCAFTDHTGGITVYSLSSVSVAHCKPSEVEWNGICYRLNKPDASSSARALVGASCTSGLCVAISNSGTFDQLAVGRFIGKGWDGTIKCPCFNGSARLSAVACSLDSTTPLQLGCAFVTSASKGTPGKEYVGHVSLLK